MNHEEEWRYVPNFPEYVVSNMGRIHRTGVQHGRPLSLTVAGDGEVVVFLIPIRDGHRYRLRLDRIVAAAFLKTRLGNLTSSEVIHLDGNLENCRADNLRWSEE